MKLLADENIPQASVRQLREAGQDIVSISETDPGISDAGVMQRAHAERRVVVTFDRDYGELVFRRNLPVPAGVLYLRFRLEGPLDVAVCISNLLARKIELEGWFTVADRDQVRQRRLPARSN